MKLARFIPAVLCSSIALTFAILAPVIAPAQPVESPAEVAALGFLNESEGQTREFFEAVIESAEARGAFDGDGFLVNLTYSDGGAPSYQTEIARSTAIWNAAVNQVQLREVSSGGDFTYTEGRSSLGSNASSDGRGHGRIFLDTRQMAQYNKVRVIAHETGHVLGLPDNYSGPCSELMSGGGAGTSCQNSQPNSAERARVNQIFRNLTTGTPVSALPFGG